MISDRATVLKGRPGVKRIALLMERMVGFNYSVLEGVRAYASSRHQWICQFIDPKLENLELVRQWEPHGAIAFIAEQKVAAGLEALGVPVVDVACWMPQQFFPRVSVDDREVGAMAARHLLELGLERFAFVGNPKLSFGQMRRDGFQCQLQEEGYRCHLFNAEPERYPAIRAWTMGGINAELVHWLDALPKPVGLFADNDERALLVCEACQVGGVEVPGEVAILGVDDDPYLTELAFPPLSSIEIPAKRIGLSAAALLDGLMLGHRAPTDPILLPPSGVVQRRSTDVLALPDPVLRTAVKFVRERACSGISVQDVLAQVPVSRRTLEALFRQQLRSSPLQEIQRVRLAEARRLLSMTDLTIESIAAKTGFGSASRLSASFRSQFGVPPSQFRIEENAGESR